MSVSAKLGLQDANERTAAAGAVRVGMATGRIALLAPQPPPSSPLFLWDCGIWILFVYTKYFAKGCDNFKLEKFQINQQKCVKTIPIILRRVPVLGRMAVVGSGSLGGNP